MMMDIPALLVADALIGGDRINERFDRGHWRGVESVGICRNDHIP
jgi:hypothetical protein